MAALVAAQSLRHVNERGRVAARAGSSSDLRLMRRGLGVVSVPQSRVARRAAGLNRRDLGWHNNEKISQRSSSQHASGTRLSGGTARRRVCLHNSLSDRVDGHRTGERNNADPQRRTRQILTSPNSFSVFHETIKIVLASRFSPNQNLRMQTPLSPLPSHIGPAEFGELGQWIAIRCPMDLAPIMRKSGGIWEPGSKRWLIEPRRIGPVVRALRRETDPLFRRAGLSLDSFEQDGGGPQ